MGWVQALSEYASTFTVLIVPFRGTVTELLSAATTVTVITIPTKASVIAAILLFNSSTSCLESQVLTINKCYC